MSTRLGLSFAVLLVVPLALPACGGAAPREPARAVAPAPAAPVDASQGVARIRADAEKLAPLVRSELARRFLSAAPSLPAVAPRTLYRDADKKRVLDAESWSRIPDRDAFKPLPVDEEFYYNTRYGSPLAYTRALEVLGDAGATLPPGSRFFDFGYGGAGHLRMLAGLGVHAVGVDVDPLLPVLYGAPSDQGVIPGLSNAPGSLRLLHGSFPDDPEVRAASAGPFDVIVSKNVLKKGYIHPDRPTDESKLIRLGVDDATFLGAVFERLRPGGFFLIYNICPAPTPSDKPFVPWSDGRSPFPREAFTAAGFEVRVFDRDDTEAIRTIGRVLGWDQGEDAMDLRNDLSVLYTLIARPPG
ncbi:class I SAM-dependent methyltransferase [Polyangium sorediatum]|uniref:Methyltransferase type 11 domain-containing protein n=1 Tax=Polyangium sorediatum TaxID=889274 RepID=A0ABT6NKU4_9BACT|nr:class I SAM-dependent methyltransferase [Polyangium sorediatum]MDI1428932.1 hypothetical protein [Polyangium sorediatum]